MLRLHDYLAVGRKKLVVGNFQRVPVVGRLQFAELNKRPVGKRIQARNQVVDSARVGGGREFAQLPQQLLRWFHVQIEREIAEIARDALHQRQQMWHTQAIELGFNHGQTLLQKLFWGDEGHSSASFWVLSFELIQMASESFFRQAPPFAIFAFCVNPYPLCSLTPCIFSR